MERPDAASPQRLIDLAADGALGERERRRLEEMMAGDPQIAGELRRRQRLLEALGARRVAVDPGFRERVMASLGEPAWRRRRLASWRLTAAAVAALLLAGTGLMSWELSRVGAADGGLVAAIASFATATLTSGAGLLGASWKGVGLALGEALRMPEMIVFGVAVLAVDLLLVLLLARRRSGRAIGEDAHD